MKLFINIMICFLIFTCTSYVPNVKYYKENFTLKDSLSTVAVMDFEYNGWLLTKKHATDAADNLNADLFVKKSIAIIDRSIVKRCLQKYETSKQGRYSQEEIKNIGKELGAVYIILGSIQSFGTMEEYHESQKNKVNMTVRILNALTGEVIGIGKHTVKSGMNMDELVKKMAGEMASYIY
jgi:hypothetical protein